MDQVDNEQIDLLKLSKLDKLLVKVDIDLKKKQKDLTKASLVEVLKKTHEIYQIVLYEVSEMLEQAKLSDLRQILTKIYNGQNNILNFTLKLNTNFEVAADKILDGLSANPAQARRKSFTQDGDDSSTNRIVNSIVTTGFQIKKGQKKTFSEKNTDTGDDMRNARDTGALKQKEEEVIAFAKELDEESQKVSDFLKNRKNETLAVGESKAQENLKEVLKDLGKKRREAEQIENDALYMQEMQSQQKMNMGNLQSSLIDGLRNMQKQAKDSALDDIKKGNAVYKNGELVYLSHVAVGTEDEKEDPRANRRNKLQVDQKQLQFDKQLKDANIESTVLRQQIQELNNKLQQANLDNKKRKDDTKQVKVQSETVLSKGDLEKMKKLVEDNIKMKLRIKTLVDNITDLEKELGKNLERFKSFILSANLPEELKKQLMQQAETLFRPDFASKLNLSDMKELMTFDGAMYKDPMFKNIMGGDIVSTMREVKKKEAVRAAKIKNIPDYDPQFDATQLDSEEKIIIRKVKKIIQRQDSHGGWVEEEVEVEEEVVINTKTGLELRKRDKPAPPPPNVQQSASTKAFMDAHGGFAIGGAKIKMPTKPVAKNGQAVKEGEWFEDNEGKKVRVVKGKDGEEVYEHEEEIIDSNGVKQKFIRRIVMKKDVNGEDMVEEEVIGSDGRVKKVLKRVTKDKDGNQVQEEITVDEKGNKVIRRQKVTKDADGIEVIIEEIIDSSGNKQIIRRKVVKGADGVDVIIEERVDAQGNKVITRIKKNELGQEEIEQEIIDKNGKSKKVNKKIIMDKDGQPIIQEAIYDDRGNVVGTKVIKVRKDAQGNEVIEEEIIGSDGKKQIKKIKKIRNQDGTETIEEEIIGSDGKKQIKRVKKIRNLDGTETIEEEYVDDNGNVVVIKKKQYRDREGNIVQEEEKYDEKTGLKTIIKSKRDAQGNETVEQQNIDKEGKVTVSNIKKVTTKDKDGNTVTNEIHVDSDGKTVTVQKKVFKDQDGREVKEEVITDSNGNQKIIRTKVVKDRDGNEIVEETVINADGTRTVKQKKIIRDADNNQIEEETVIAADGTKTVVRKKISKDKQGNEIVEETVVAADGTKTVVRKKVYKDAEGNEVIEEEKIDSSGNRVIVKIRKGVNGESILEETKIGLDGKQTKTVKKLKRDENGNIEETVTGSDGKQIIRKIKKDQFGNNVVEETVIAADGKKTITITKVGLDNKQTQTEGTWGGAEPSVDDLLDRLQALGVDKTKLDQIKAQVLMKQKIKGNKNKKQQEDDEKKMRHMEEQKEEAYRNKSQESNESFDTLDGDGENDEDQAGKLYQRLIQNKDGGFGDLLRQVRNSLGKQGNDKISAEEFQEYLEKMKQIHQKCGENCPHLRRFYEKLGFSQKKYKRRYLKMKDTRIEAKKKLPQISTPKP